MLCLVGSVALPAILHTGYAQLFGLAGKAEAKEDIETVKLIYHLVKERGMTLPGARQRMKDNKENTLRNFEIVDRLKAIREELLSMKRALDGFTYEQVEELKKDIQEIEG